MESNGCKRNKSSKQQSVDLIPPIGSSSNLLETNDEADSVGNIRLSPSQQKRPIAYDCNRTKPNPQPRICSTPRILCLLT